MSSKSSRVRVTVATNFAHIILQPFMYGVNMKFQLSRVEKCLITFGTLMIPNVREEIAHMAFQVLFKSVSNLS